MGRARHQQETEHWQETKAGAEFDRLVEAVVVRQ